MHATPIRDTGLFVERSGAGPAVLFLHGFPLDHGMWREAIGALGEAFDCIAPDLRGFGRSNAPLATPLTMEQHADDAAALLDSLGVQRAHVVALSMGGYAALAFAERHAARLASLALVDTRAAADDEKGRAARSAAADHVLEAGRAVFAREMLEKLVAPSASLEVRARLLSTMEATPYETIVAALLGMRARPDRTHVLQALDCPLLIVCGELDVITPPDASRAMAAANPHGELALIPDAGHMSPMERPREFAAILADFLARQR